MKNIFEINKDLGINISNSLDAVASAGARKIADTVISIAMSKCNSPEEWPLRFDSKSNLYSSLGGCQRTLSILRNILDGYGILLHEGEDFLLVNVGPKYTDTGIADDVCADEAEIIDVPPAADVSKVSKTYLSDKMQSVYVFIAEQIYAAAENGESSVILKAIKPPFSGNSRILKRVFKKLDARGYSYTTNVVAGSEGFYKNLRTITITW